MLLGDCLRLVHQLLETDLRRPVDNEPHGAMLVIIEQQDHRLGEDLAAHFLGGHQQPALGKCEVCGCHRRQQPGQAQRPCQVAHHTVTEYRLYPGATPGATN